MSCHVPWLFVARASACDCLLPRIHCLNCAIQAVRATAKYCWPCNTVCNATVEKATGNDCSTWTAGGDYHPQACDNATGLPWLCHDGYANPINDHLDRGLWDSLYYTVPPLALSAFLTSNATQAQRAAQLTRTWFVDPASRMNPNLKYAQAIPGSNNGTSGGIIDISDHHKLLDIVDGMTMLAASPDPAVAAAWSGAELVVLVAARADQRLVHHGPGAGALGPRVRAHGRLRIRAQPAHCARKRRIAARNALARLLQRRDVRQQQRRRRDGRAKAAQQQRQERQERRCAH
jgi:hypothetical protein